MWKVSMNFAVDMSTNCCKYYVDILIEPIWISLNPHQFWQWVNQYLNFIWIFYSFHSSQFHFYVDLNCNPNNNNSTSSKNDRNVFVKHCANMNFCVKRRRNRFIGIGSREKVSIFQRNIMWFELVDIHNKNHIYLY